MEKKTKTKPRGRKICLRRDAVFTTPPKRSTKLKGPAPPPRPADHDDTHRLRRFSLVRKLSQSETVVASWPARLARVFRQTKAVNPNGVSRGVCLKCVFKNKGFLAPRALFALAALWCSFSPPRHALFASLAATSSFYAPPKK